MNLEYLQYLYYRIMRESQDQFSRYLRIYSFNSSHLESFVIAFSFFFLILETGEGRETERERKIHPVAFLTHPNQGQSPQPRQDDAQQLSHTGWGICHCFLTRRKIFRVLSFLN